MKKTYKLNLDKYTKFLEEILWQPAWRSRADKECDYYDGNQLDSDVLQAQATLGIPPAIEPIIGSTIDSVLGMEAKMRLDWRVKAEIGSDELAEALNEKLNEAERKSKADQACSDAYAPQIKVGLGWVEVSRNPNPFEYKYRCRAIHRNEIWWDWLAKEPDLSDARYLIRRKWMDVDQAVLMFGGHEDLIKGAATGWQSLDLASLSIDGGQSTMMAMSQEYERGWSIEEMEWRDIANNRVCLFECWYRIWEKALVIKTPDGRVVEYEKDNPTHMLAIATGKIKPVWALVSRMNLSWWVGPHLLWAGPSPYKHNKFPYVPFWGKREDRTGAPYGLIRGMMYLQDEINARISKMQWLLSATRTIRTEGAYAGSDDDLRYEVGRPDADIVLDPQKMKDGGVFKIDRDNDLNQQQYQRLIDCRESIKRVSNIHDAYMGKQGEAKSGVALDTLVEQSTQGLAEINVNFKQGRRDVGDLLLSLIIEDMGSEPQEVVIPASVTNPKKVVKINEPAEEQGVKYLDNDIQRVMLRVELADVPSTPTYRAQQLQTLGAVLETMPPHYQVVGFPFLLSLMDIPNREEFLTAIKEADQQITPEQVKKMVEDAKKQARLEAMTAQKDRELDIKEKQSEVDQIKKGIEAILSAMEAAGMLQTNPQAGNVSDAVIEVAQNLIEPEQEEIPEMPEMPEMEEQAQEIPEMEQGMEELSQ